MELQCDSAPVIYGCCANVPQSSMAAPTSSSPTEVQQLQGLMNVLKKKDMELDPEAQAVMNKVKVITPKEASKLMHGAVSRLDNAKDKLQKALDARQNMHRNWGKFVSDAVVRWQKHTENFTKEDSQLQEAIVTATTACHTGRAHLEETKGANDDDIMTDTTPDLPSGIQELVHSLTRLRDSQESQWGSLQKAKNRNSCFSCPCWRGQGDSKGFATFWSGWQVDQRETCFTLDDFHVGFRIGPTPSWRMTSTRVRWLPVKLRLILALNCVTFRNLPCPFHGLVLQLKCMLM